MHNYSIHWGGSRGGSGGSVEPPKLNVKTYNKHVVKKSEPTHLINISFENGGDFRAIKPLQIAPENARNRISEALKLKIFQGNMSPDSPRGYRLWRAFIRTPVHQILDPSQLHTKGAYLIRKQKSSTEVLFFQGIIIGSRLLSEKPLR